jgi:hypothetical protein
MNDESGPKDAAAMLRARAQALGAETLLRMRDEWAVLITEIEEARARGVEPGDQALRPLLERWRAQIRAVTEGNPTVVDALASVSRGSAAETLLAQSGVTRDFADYLAQAMSAAG